MAGFVGYVTLEGTIVIPFLTRSGNQPLDAASLPTFRVYGPAGLMQNGTGTAAFRDSGTVTGATNASPIVIASTAHGLKTGNIVTISGVLTNTNANGTFTITEGVDANHYSLNGTTGNGAYGGGGTWHVTGLYYASVTAAAANGYAAGVTYTLTVQGSVNSANWADYFEFTVS